MRFCRKGKTKNQKKKKKKKGKIGGPSGSKGKDVESGIVPGDGSGAGPSSQYPREDGEDQRLTQDIVVKEGMTRLQKTLFAVGIILVCFIVLFVILILASAPWNDKTRRTVAPK